MQRRESLSKSLGAGLAAGLLADTGGRYSPKTFHERFMRMGTIPVRYFHDEFLSE